MTKPTLQEQIAIIEELATGLRGESDDAGNPEDLERLALGTVAAAETLRACEPRPIKTAPKDGQTEVLVYAPGVQELRPVFCVACYHKDAGWCIDELREPTHWWPLPPMPEPVPGKEEA